MFFLLFVLILFWLYDVCLFMHMCCVHVVMWCIWLNPKYVALCKTKSDWIIFQNLIVFLKQNQIWIIFQNLIVFLNQKSDLDFPFGDSFCYLIKKLDLGTFQKIHFLLFKKKLDLNFFYQKIHFA